MRQYIAEKKINEELNGIEIYFFVYPLNGTKNTLKENGFRWNHKKGCWYSKRSTTSESIASICAETTLEEYKQIATGTGETVNEVKKAEQKATKTKKAAKKATANKFGVKVGDFFCASWGYDQTNNDFFQVIELVGATSVRVREVIPPIISREACSGMSEDRTFKLDRNVILPPAPRACFIEDQEKGDLKRLKSYSKDGISNPQFYLTSYTDAYYCTGDTEKVYESWYA